MGVYVDTDMGFKDIVAILVLPHVEIEIDGISLVFGNSMLPQDVRNESAVARVLGRDIPICADRAILTAHKAVEIEVEKARRLFLGSLVVEAAPP